MKSIWKNTVGAMMLVGATTLVTTQVVSQHDANQDQQQMTDEMMEMWMKLGEPGEQHKMLARMAGTWEQKTTHWMFPGSDPIVSTAKAKMKSIMGGRYVIEQVEGHEGFMGQEVPYEGFGIFAFDNMTQKHHFVWIDNMSTMMMLGEGTAAEDGTITYHSEMENPMGPEKMKFKSKARQVSDDRFVFEMWALQPDGSWFRNMESVSVRK
jgi:hypothetical protein